MSSTAKTMDLSARAHAGPPDNRPNAVYEYEAHTGIIAVHARTPSAYDPAPKDASPIEIGAPINGIAIPSHSKKNAPKCSASTKWATAGLPRSGESSHASSANSGTMITASAFALTDTALSNT